MIAFGFGASEICTDYVFPFHPVNLILYTALDEDL
jgi:hypothetical protein